jgi:N-acetylglucosamine-6-phosphate deacetylase
MRKYALAADKIFDGAALHDDAAVIVEETGIAALVPRGEIPASLPVRVMGAGVWLAPGFIDIQVNGGGDVLFNDMPTPEGIAAIAAAHRQFGTTGLLPTLISDTAEKMRQARAAVASATADHPGVLGIHFEGPFLSPQRPGVHDRSMLRRPGPEDLAFLTMPADFVTQVTLAPEEVPPAFIAGLAHAGVRVALGHSVASYDETRQALTDGLTGFTHLFNAMPPLTAREPGPVAAALEAKGAFVGLIVDGMHVAPSMLRLALRGSARPMLVTDAMPPVGGRLTRFALCSKRVVVQGGRCTTEDGTLAGSALDMASAVRNAVRLLDLPLVEAVRMASTTPAEFLGQGRRLGRLAPGYRADIVALDPAKVQVLATWLAGNDGAAA